MWFIIVYTLIANKYASLLFSQTFLFYYFCMLSKSEKVFERKVWRVQVAHLHNGACALSSRSKCWQRSLSLSLIMWQKPNRMWSSMVCTLIDNNTGHHSGQNLLRNHFLFRHIDKARDGHFQSLSSHYNHLTGGDYSGIWCHSRPMRVRGFL